MFGDVEKRDPKNYGSTNSMLNENSISPNISISIPELIIIYYANKIDFPRIENVRASFLLLKKSFFYVGNVNQPKGI